MTRRPRFAHAFVFNGNPGSTPAEPEGALALPGRYRIRLTVDGRQYTQPLTVVKDPRSRAAPVVLAAQHALLMRLSSGVRATWAGFKSVAELRARVAQIAPGDTGRSWGRPRRRWRQHWTRLPAIPWRDVRLLWDARPATWNFVNLSREFALQMLAQDNADQRPTRAALAVARASCGDLSTLVARWRRLVRVDLPAFNRSLAGHGMAMLAAPPAGEKVCAP